MIASEYAKHLASTIVAAERTVEDFAARLTDVHSTPAHALEWSMAAFEAAARLHVRRQVKAAIDKGRTLDGIREYALKEALRGASSPERSTSPVSNVMSQCITAEWAAIVSDLEGGASC